MFSTRESKITKPKEEFQVPLEYLPKQFSEVVFSKRIRHPDYGDYENSKVRFNF